MECRAPVHPVLHFQVWWLWMKGRSSSFIYQFLFILLRSKARIVHFFNWVFLCIDSNWDGCGWLGVCVCVCMFVSVHNQILLNIFDFEIQFYSQFLSEFFSQHLSNENHTLTSSLRHHTDVVTGIQWPYSPNSTLILTCAKVSLSLSHSFSLSPSLPSS